MITLQKAIKADQCMGLYDWANSVYSLVIATAVFPIYYETVTSSNNGVVQFLGVTSITRLYYHTPFHSLLIVALMSPILSGIADYTGNKKRFMKFSVIWVFFCNEFILLDKTPCGLGFRHCFS
jgi:UMF1 family MFS transporter